MNFDDLLKKYRELQKENRLLKERIKLFESQICSDPGDSDAYIKGFQDNSDKNVTQDEVTKEKNINSINNYSSPSEKIDLFMSLFSGRDDVYAKRWENKNKGSSGYSPACGNEWIPGLCQKPKIKCSACKNKNYLKLDRQAIEGHLRGKTVIGIYPLLSDERCWFLAMDFDGEGWQQDITTIREVCSENKMPVAVERSRSGDGAHIWFFFEQPITAFTARKFGSALLTAAMNRRHQISFKSYDRLFPNQDTMPKGGFGNLIALPLQKEAGENNNSVFIDENSCPFSDQWAFLLSITRLSPEYIETFIVKLCQGNELGTLKKDDEEEITKPWEPQNKNLNPIDFPEVVEIVKSNMLFISKTGFSQKALNRIKRLGAFKNPDFYKAQAMRLSTYNKPRIVSCTDETDDYLGLPRGCETDLKNLFSETDVEVKWIDKRNSGQKTKVDFKGTLRDEQPLAVKELLKHDIGVLCGTTAFGKTVVAINIIAEKKVNTLILVNKVSLIKQWKEKLTEFLTVIEKEKSGNQIEKSLWGQIGNGKQIRIGIDIAIMQSLIRKGDVKDLVKDYGMVIVDECHHVPAVSFEMILKNVNAKYVYGLTATPTRKDGHHPIIFMQCGPIRYRDDAKNQAEKRPFEHYIIPRFTSLRIHKLSEKEEKDRSIQELYAEVIKNETRNQQIADDVYECYNQKRNCIVLTERIEHVKELSGYASIGYKIKGESFSPEEEKEKNMDIIFNKNNFFSVFSVDLFHADREILIVSPFVTKRRVMQILQDWETPLSKNVKVIVITRPEEDFPKKDLTAWHEAIRQLKIRGVHLIFTPNIHQKFAIIDQKIIWYGSINLLSYGNAEESIMRIESPKIAYELIESMERLNSGINSGRK